MAKGIPVSHRPRCNRPILGISPEPNADLALHLVNDMVIMSPTDLLPKGLQRMVAPCWWPLVLPPKRFGTTVAWARLVLRFAMVHGADMQSIQRSGHKTAWIRSRVFGFFVLGHCWALPHFAKGHLMLRIVQRDGAGFNPHQFFIARTKARENSDFLCVLDIVTASLDNGPFTVRRSVRRIDGAHHRHAGQCDTVPNAA